MSRIDLIEEEGEHCQACGRAYLSIGWWYADDDLWAEITDRSDGSGLLCPDCFGRMARAKGIGLRWRPEVNWRTADGWSLPGRCAVANSPSVTVAVTNSEVVVDRSR